jgi:hypothetical protein
MIGASPAASATPRTKASTSSSFSSSQNGRAIWTPSAPSARARRMRRQAVRVLKAVQPICTGSCAARPSRQTTAVTRSNAASSWA